jgi:hypothetical protein
MKPAWIGTSACLHLEGTDAPRVEARWADADRISVTFDGASGLQSISFRGTPQEVRLALAKGLAALHRAVAERAAVVESAGDGRDPQTDWLTAAERQRFAAGPVETTP